MALKSLFGEGIGFGSIGDVVRLGFGVAAGASTGPWYLAAAGSDAADGLSVLTPWQTVAKWVSGTAASQIVNLNKGDLWREFANPLPTAQTIQAYGAGLLPEITGFDVVSGTYTSASPTNTWDIAWTPAAGNVTVMRVDGVLYTKAASKAALTVGHFFWTANLLSLCITGGDSTMSGKLVEANGNRAQALTPGNGKGSYTFNSIWFSGGMNVGCLMQTQATPSTWTSCKFSHNGVTTGTAQLYFAAVGVAGHTVTDCLFTDGIADSLYAADSPSCTVSHCSFIRIYGAASDHIQMSGSSGGSGGWSIHDCYCYIQPTSDTTKGCVVLTSTTSLGGTHVYDCFLDGGNYGWSWGNAADTGNDTFLSERLVAVNQFAGTSQGSYSVGDACDGAIWKFCVSLNSLYHGFVFFNSKARTNIGVYQNTVYNAAQRAFSSATGNTMSGALEDNIFHAAPAQTDYRTIMAGTGFTSDYNDVPGEQANYMFINATGYATLALAQASGQEAHSLKGDPLLKVASNRTGVYGQSSAPVTATYADVSLSATSPARGAGLQVAGVNTAFHNPPDLGAFQFGALGPGLPGGGGIGGRMARGFSLIQKLSRGRL